MRRSALSVFFQRVLTASLPLMVPACHNSATTPVDAAAPSDFAVVVANDLAFASPDLDDDCEIEYPVTRVNTDPGNLPDGGFPTQCLMGDPCTRICPSGYMMCCAPTPSDGGAIIVDCSRPCAGGGRRPSGLATATGKAACTVGSYFARMAHLEAASVTSFRRLGRELRTHGAPARLIRAARTAARDEIRHARVMRTFAAQHGSTPAPVRVRRFRVRSVEAMARENAREGCVRETFGALVASWQARAAHDRAFATAMTQVALDETRHAELSWEVDAFLRTQLSPAANKRVQRAQKDVVEELAAELEQAPPAQLVEQLGFPDRDRALAFFAATQRALWS
jgi:hypothetical protein